MRLLEITFGFVYGVGERRRRTWCQATEQTKNGVDATLIPSIPQDEREGAPEGRRKSRKGIGGPKTATGKAAVRLNAMKHGVLALRLRS